MAQLVGALVKIVHGEMLVKVNGVEDGDELYSYQHLVDVISFRFGARGSVASELLQEGLVGFRCRSFQIHLVHLVAVCLVGERGTKQNSHFVCPADFDFR